MALVMRLEGQCNAGSCALRRLLAPGLAPLAEAGYTFDWIEHAGECSAERMHEYSTVILTKSNNVSATDQTPWITETVAAAFRKHVRRSNGLLVILSGSADYRDVPVLRAVLGGVFVSHPPLCSVTVVPREGHPLTAGSAPFTLVDEHYHMEFGDKAADVFHTSVSEHGRQPAGWARAEGAGRVCLLTPGHNLEVWLQPSYQAIIQHALRFVSRTQRSGFFHYAASEEHHDQH